MNEKFFDIIIKSLSSGVILQDKNLNILYCNKIAYTMLGLTEDQFLGKSTFDPYWACFKEDGSVYEPHEHPSARTINTGKAIEKDIMAVRKPDNTYSWISINAEPIFNNGSEKPEYVVVSYTDITALKEKEQQLEKNNEELERFAYVASHDLQEPLRKINTFLDIFYSKYKNLIDEKGMVYLNKVTDSIKRMQNLITDLLSFSRSNNITDEICLVDCNIKVEVIKDGYEQQLAQKQIKINSTKLPIIKGYKSYILSLFQNLINNAIKYNKSSVPEVSISYEETDHDYIFKFKDNGIGIDKDYLDKIFLPFQRLNSKSEYSGSGIGLSTCRRIVELHKGKIWAESDGTNGSTFIFNIPK